MRSMARWVLPVLVGPSTAVTPAPRVRDLLRRTGEAANVIDDPDCTRHKSRLNEWSAPEAPTCLTMRQICCEKAQFLTYRTSLERIAPESRTWRQSAFVLYDIWRTAAHPPLNSVWLQSRCLAIGVSFVNAPLEPVPPCARPCGAAPEDFVEGLVDRLWTAGGETHRAVIRHSRSAQHLLRF